MSDPSQIRSEILEFAQRFGIEHPAETAALFTRWEEIVGKEVAARARPMSLKDGILKLITDSPAWASELRYLRPELIRRVNRELGSDVVTDVRAMVARGGDARGKRR